MTWNMSSQKLRWKQWLKDPNVQRWHDNMARGSVLTAAHMMSTLDRFLLATKHTPQSLVKLKSEKRDDLVGDFIANLYAQGRAGSYAKAYKGAITSWLEWNRQSLTRPIKITNVNVRQTLKKAHMPSQEELRAVLNAADARARTAITLIAFSGLRPEVLGKHDASDGLCLKDFPEAHLKNGVLGFDKVPTRVVVREELSKSRREYFTFLGQEGCQYLAAFVREQHEAGEKLTPETMLFRPRKRDAAGMRTQSISEMVRRPMRAAGMKNNPPYVWRSFFSNRTLMAESEGLLRDFRVYMSGHAGSLEVEYGLRKTLQDDVVERMRAGYKAALKYLETQARDSESPRLALATTILEVAGYSPEQVAGFHVEKKAPQELVELMRGAFHKVRQAAVKQRTVTVDQLDEALAAGWTFRTELTNGKILVEAPAS